MKTDKWIQGYACCLATMINMDGCNTQHIETYRAGFGLKTESNLIALGVDQYDIDIFKKEGLLKP